MINPHTNLPADARLLIVDDHERDLIAMERILRLHGCTHCVLVSDPSQAVEYFMKLQPDLLLLDWHMPDFSGAEVLRALRAQLSEQELPPVLVLTADTCPETRREALREGATDFLSKPVDHLEMLLRIRNLLRLRKLHLQNVAANQRLESQVRERTYQLETALKELRDMQEHFIQQERLHALGSMAAGIAHDFNNALMIIRGYSAMFVEQPELCDETDRVLDCFTIIDTASTHAADIVRRLREFYRPYCKKEEERDLVSLNDLLQEVAHLSRPRWETQTQARGAAVHLRTELQPVPLISASASELREVLLNLIFNAVDAMPDGGEIVLRSGTDGEGRVLFEVEDSGVGMSEHTRRHCLEPFYTTKGDQGTGLGLAIIYGIIRRHNGIVRINSEIGRGTQMTVLLPIAMNEDAVEEPAEIAPASEPIRILLVDDQPGICNVLAQMLHREGHKVASANDGCHALEMFQQDHYDLVITDCAMPIMNGGQLTTALKEIQPTLPVLMLTACMEEIDPAQEPADLVLAKPATLPQLREAINRLMQQAVREECEVVQAA